MNGTVNKVGLYPRTERSWPFVYSMHMDLDSAQVGRSQVNLNFYAFNYCSITSRVESSQRHHGRHADAECAGEELKKEKTIKM